MNTPICDFVNQYIKSDALRLHVPGHKGKNFLGFEKYDTTEITGADSLYHADGIIKESEHNASLLFESGATFYSTEGSSHIIRTMLYLAKVYSGRNDGFVLAGRNAHSSFISACALNDIDVEWIFPEDDESYLSCVITKEKLEKALMRVDKTPICVYITSPDYLGNVCDIKELSCVCEKFGTMLIVDNAHGSYLKFLEKDLHPISLGAAMCSDSAHKTLPVLTGGAYLHINKNAPSFFKENAKQALSLFGSTSPSYLTLASLDMANKYISEQYKNRLNDFVKRLKDLLNSFIDSRSEISDLSSAISFREPLKLTLIPKKFGYRAKDFAKILESSGVSCEFFDDDYLVLMFTPENGINQVESLFDILSSFEYRAPIKEDDVKLIPPTKVMTVREASFAKRRLVSIDEALGKALATSSVSCPPAVSVIVCGEEFNQSAIDLCKKHGFHHVYIVE